MVTEGLYCIHDDEESVYETLESLEDKEASKGRALFYSLQIEDKVGAATLRVLLSCLEVDWRPTRPG